METIAGRTLDAQDIARLAVLAFLHDAGKLHPGFQAKAWPVGSWLKPLHGHVQEGAAIFCSDAVSREIKTSLQLESLAHWGVSKNWFYATFAHHGRPFNLENAASQQWVEANGANYSAITAAAEMGALLPQWFPPAFVSDSQVLPDSPSFHHLFCGLVSLADWLGSDTRVFEFKPQLDPNYITEARGRAAQAAINIGLDVQHLRAGLQCQIDFESISPGHEPRSGQRIIGDWPLDDQLVILEAETGSGKTEAALWRFAQLFAAGKVDSLYFALPTRAAAKQIHGRIDRVAKRLFGETAPEAVLAIPGYMKSGDVEGQNALAGFEVLWDDEPDARKTLQRWAAENTKRYLAATIAAGTVDQAMLAALQVKHAHLRAASLCRSLLVIDEVHASDPYMIAVQKHLIETHLARGGFAMLMSATLGSIARTKWLSANKKPPEVKLEDAIKTPYPVVWGRRAGMRDAASTYAPQKRARMALANSWSPELAAQQAIEAAAKGAKVLLIRNTVTSAIATFNAVQDAGHSELLWQVAGGPALHHSRFAPGDRKLLDDHVEIALSKDEQKRPQGGMIVIGTQTLEQSLDICADLLITDLCPADVLLQRIGRLHRHKLNRPKGFEQPHCIVLAPEGGLDRLAAPTFDNGLGMFHKNGGGVYINLHACELTRRLVLERSEWMIPSMNRLLVETATHPESIEKLNKELGKSWENYFNTVYGKDIAEAMSARGVVLNTNKPFTEAVFPYDDEKVRTRLGAEGAVVKFTSPVPSPFGPMISSVTLPAHWSHGLHGIDPVTPQDDGGGKHLISLPQAAFRYSRQGLEKAKT